MKRKVLTFFAGVFVLCIILSQVSVFAESIDVLFNAVNIKINGKQVASVGEYYTLHNGDKVPFSISYKGTTYLPMRKLSELLDKDVTWDGSTSTASVDDNKEMTSETAKNIEKELIYRDTLLLLKISTRLAEIAQDVQIAGFMNNSKNMFVSVVDTSEVYEKYYNMFGVVKKSFNDEKQYYISIINRIAIGKVNPKNTEAALKISKMMSNIEDIIRLQEDLFSYGYDYSKHIKISDKLYDVKTMNAQISTSLSIME